MKHTINGHFHNMTKIKIKHLNIHNFLSFQDEEWDFDGTSRLVLIKGVNKDNWQASGEASNGSGKSAWSHALMYALFGQLTGKVHNSNLKNKYSDTMSQSGYKMSVDVEVDTEVSGSTRHWKIVRGIQKTQTVVLQLFTMDDGDWKDISKSTSANTQKFIEDNVLFMNFEMYQRLVMLSLDDKYIFFKLNASQKRDFVETMFDTSVYSNMYRMMSEDLKTRNIILQNLKVNQVKLEKSRELCEDEISRYKAGVNDKIVETTAERDSLQQKISTFDPKFKEIEVRQKAIEDAMAKIQESKRKLDEVLGKCKDRITNSRIAINNCQTTISHHEREIEKHKEVLGMICDDCQKVVNKFYSLDVYRDEIVNLNEQVADEENTIRLTQEQIDKVKVYDDKLKEDETARMSELSDTHVQERNLQFQKTQLLNSVSELERRIADLQASIDDESRIPSYSLYQQVKSDMERLENDLRDESTRLCLLKIGSEIVSPDSIRRNIISRMVSSINAMINANLTELCANFTCNLTNDMNDYEIQSSGGELDFPNLSLGEQMKLVISSQLAFRKFLMSRFNICMNIMIIDEVVDRALDSVSIQKLLGMLLQLSQKENTSVSIISHRVEVENMFRDMPETQLMIVQKRDHISKIVRD